MPLTFKSVIDYLLPFRGKADPDAPLNFYDLPDDTLTRSLGILDDADPSYRQLIGRQAALTYMNMSRDGQIAGMLGLLTGPIVSSRWQIEGSQSVKMFLEEQLGIGADPSGRVVFDKVLREALTCLPYGYALQERVFQPVGGMLTLERLGFRYQTSIKEFVSLDRDFLRGVRQYLRFTPKEEVVFIPVDNLVYYAPFGIGATWEGQSVLRGAYKHWFIKQKLYLIEAVSARRFGVPILVGRYADHTSEQNRKAFGQQLANINSHQKGYLLIPQGDFELEFLSLAEQAAPSLKGPIDHHNEQIVAAMAAQLLSLGNQRAASRALGQTLSALFYNVLKSYSDHVRDVLQARVVSPLVKANFPRSSAKLTYSHLDNSDFSRLVEAMSSLAEKGLLTPGADTEENLRGRLELPEENRPYPREETKPDAE